MTYEKPTEKEYKKIWGSHVDDFTRLKWHLDQEDQIKVSKAQKDLKDLVEKAWKGKKARAKRMF